MASKDGYIDFKGYQTYYCIHGDLKSKKTPLVVLHGGPGYTHYYLENLSKLADEGRPVVLYDQLGCGRSDRPNDPDLWTIDLFVEELGAIVDFLRLENFDLIGHSWGGSLALEYAFKWPKLISKLILSSPLLDTKLWVEEAKRLVSELPNWAATIMQNDQTEAAVNSYAYQQAYAEYKKRYICRLEAYPKELVQSDNQAGSQVYSTMWGPNEVLVSGILAGWTSLDRIHQIKLPTLFISGQYDEATPKQIEAAKKLLPGSEWVMLDNCSHVGNLENPDKYRAVVSDFLG